MYHRETILNKEATEKLVSGVNKIADAVGATLGAEGSTVIYPVTHEENTVYSVTKDGITVANSVLPLKDPIENQGAQLARDASNRTAQGAGDGTTTSLVLTQALINNSLDLEVQSLRHFTDGMIDASKDVEKYIDDYSTEATNEDIRNIAYVSTNNNNELADLISEASEAVGKYGEIKIIPTASSESYVNVIRGTSINKGFADPLFINNEEKQEVRYDDALIFVSTMKIPNIAYIEPLLEYAVDNDKPLLIIAEMEGDVATTIANNVTDNGYKFCLVDPPSMGLFRREYLDDIAALSGATLHGPHTGDNVEFITPDLLGTVKQFVSIQDNTYLLFDEESRNRPIVRDRVKLLENLIAEEKNKNKHEPYRDRISSLIGGLSAIYVGGNSEIEVREKCDRVDDAKKAVTCTLEEGYLPGGGIVLKEASEEIKRKDGDSDYDKGYNVLLDSIVMPHKKILSNAGMSDLYGPYKKGQGIDVVDGSEKNMVEAGIIDPTLVTRSALLNSVSVATTILRTSVAIYNEY